MHAWKLLFRDLIWSSHQPSSGAFGARCRGSASHDCRSGLVAPASYFGTSKNQLGITSNSWQACASSYAACQEPFGACTAISDRGPYDQFAAFRSSTMAQLSPLASYINCSFLFNDYFTAPYGTFWTTYVSCDYGGGYLAVNLAVNTTLLNMTYGYGPSTHVNKTSASSSRCPRSLMCTLLLTPEMKSRSAH